MRNPFDFRTAAVLQIELDRIHEALMLQEIEISPHAEQEADAENIPLSALLEAILVGTAISKDLPDNTQKRVPGINFERQLDDKRWIRTKVAWFDGYVVITVHTV